MSNHYDILVIGSGPAGFTAGIYTSRANLKTGIFEGMQPGGQLMITTDVENFPGFEHGVQGPEMMDIFRNQAKKFGSECIMDSVVKVDFASKPFKMWTETGKEYTSDAVIIATGAKARRLDMPSEKDYWGYGISACATCDGFFYKGKKVFVVGGGDTAMEEANYLTHFATSVTIVHRRQEFRASKIMLERAQKNPKINFLVDSVIEEFMGESIRGIKSLTGVKIKNLTNNQEEIHSTDGVFLAIGHDPNTSLFKDVIHTDEEGYIVTHGKSTYTNIPGVFACGDVQDHVYRQAVSAAGTGCMAAIDSDRWLWAQKSK